MRKIEKIRAKEAARVLLIESRNLACLAALGIVTWILMHTLDKVDNQKDVIWDLEDHVSTLESELNELKIKHEAQVKDLESKLKETSVKVGYYADVSEVREVQLLSRPSEYLDTAIRYLEDDLDNAVDIVPSSHVFTSRRDCISFMVNQFKEQEALISKRRANLLQEWT